MSAVNKPMPIPAIGTAGVKGTQLDPVLVELFIELIENDNRSVRGRRSPIGPCGPAEDHLQLPAKHPTLT